ncbi:hypothetical protein GALMADRAFT_159643 [Galerina marginata CBS 339.88]|uniref:DUF6699 domain-containing protein n=1 Tax=Galerina marginata (strain CBS 339.88) TaxID=685588 RepID=A0A067SJR3_GALM3|nr:hypothetical protein GALMADRAFT_159643 [Galerina marginata CBS 339.88]
MSHGHPYPYSDSSSAKSWGTASSTPYYAHPPQGSSASSWGTASTKSPLSPTTNFSVGPPGSVSNVSSWGSQSGHTVPPYTSPPPSYPGSPQSLGTSISKVSVGGQAPPYFGHPPGPSPASPYVNLYPGLQDGRLGIDLSLPPYTYAGIDSPAFSPNMTYMEIVFERFPMWVLRVHTADILTVKTVLEHIHFYLQEPDYQKYQTNAVTNSHHHMAYHRDHNASFASHSTPNKRVDVLGRTKFVGLTPRPGGNNCWVLHTC